MFCFSFIGTNFSVGTIVKTTFEYSFSKSFNFIFLLPNAGSTIIKLESTIFSRTTKCSLFQNIIAGNGSFVKLFALAL